MSTSSLGHELIRASAGTGKTYELTNRYLRLLRCGQRPDDILASTFTRKAAGEITGRLLLRLAEAATDEAKRADLQAALGDPALARGDCLTMLVGMICRLHRLRISTLDSFFAQLAASFALEIGLPPGWRIAEEYEDAALRAEAIDAVLDNEDPRSLLTLMHALTGGETTRSLDREVRDKINAMYATYRESGRDAWHRVPRLRELPEAQIAEALQTLRSVRLPQHREWEKAHQKHVQAAEAGDWKAFVKDGIAKAVAASKDSYRTKPIDAAVASAYRPLIDHAKAVLLNQLANQTEATYHLVDRFHAQYQQLKLQARVLRFEDLTFQLAGRFPAVLRADLGSGNTETGEEIDGNRLAVRLDAGLQHLLLDEFQDTSLAQWSVIRPLARQIAGTESNQSFFCVGDTKQAIYGWRGGVAEIFDAVTREVAGVQQRSLDTSWRSSPPIIQAVNQIFQNLHRHKNLGELAGAVARWQTQFHRHQTAEPKRGLNGYVCLQAARAASDDEADPQEDTTLRFVAKRVADWTKKAQGFDVGVLVRRNDTVRQLIYELRELGIEASEEGGSSLSDSAAVRLILSLVQLADHPGDLVARFHVATSPLAASLDLFPAVDQTDGMAGSAGNGMDTAMQFASHRGDAAAGHVARGIRRQLVVDGYGPTVCRLVRQLAPACNRRELRRAEKLIGLAYQYDDAATSRPRDFAAYVASAKVRDPISASVRVMTVHQAKGLEFDIVVLADLESDLIGQRGDLVVGRPSSTEPIDRVCRYCNKDVQQLLPAAWQQLFHKIEWLDDGPPSDDRLREAAARSGLTFKPDDLDRWLAEFQAMLARPPIAACLHRSAYRDFAGARLRVETERPLAVRDGDRLLVGSIDRLVTICRGENVIAADILDFKTDAIADQDQGAVLEKVRFYTPQLQAYRQAVQKLAGGDLPQISAKLLLLEAGLVIPIPTAGGG